MTHQSLHVLSNGHGEDEIACKIIDAIQAYRPCHIRISAWAMVGAGLAFRRRGISLEGPANLLPGEGFGTHTLRGFLRDLKAGFITTHLTQVRHALALRGKHDLLLGVGDVVPLLAGQLADTPMAFVACAKSAYYGGFDGHTPLERYLMRKNCVDVFSRDALTNFGFIRNGVASRYVGNPMMDGLSARILCKLPRGMRGVALLPGSRADAVANALFLMTTSARLLTIDPSLIVMMACPPGMNAISVASAACVEGYWSLKHAKDPEQVEVAHKSGGKALLVVGAISKVLQSCEIAVGMAGTANEQAVGLGLPLITLPGLGNQGKAYQRMKSRYFGDSALAVERNADKLNQEILGLLNNPARTKLMVAAGKARMGAPGASDAIAKVLIARLQGQILQ
jgi:uncharacterized protein (TIGR03492 family)